MSLYAKYAPKTSPYHKCEDGSLLYFSNTNLLTAYMKDMLLSGINWLIFQALFVVRYVRFKTLRPNIKELFRQSLNVTVANRGHHTNNLRGTTVLWQLYTQDKTKSCHWSGCWNQGQNVLYPVHCPVVCELKDMTG